MGAPPAPSRRAKFRNGDEGRSVAERNLRVHEQPDAHSVLCF